MAAHRLTVVKEAAHEVAGCPLLVHGVRGTTWTFSDSAHTTPRVHSWHHQKALAQQLSAHGYCVMDDVLPSAAVEQIAAHVRSLHRSGALTPGQQYDAATALGKRGDVVCMSASNDPRCPALHDFVLLADKVYAAMSSGVPELVAAGPPHRSQPMLALYPGDGACYPRHTDNPDDNGRICTCILYLNGSWKEGDGGELRIAPNMRADDPPEALIALDIPPVMGRFVMFFSDERVPHEVLPAHASRAACTIWFVDRAKFTDFHSGRGGSAKPAPRRPAPTQSLAARLLAAMESSGVGLRARLLGKERHAEFSQSLPVRLRHLHLLANDAAATVGWLSAPPGESAVHDAAEAMLEELAAAASGAMERILRRRKLERRMLLVQHNDCAAHSVAIEPGALPTVEGLALVYCLRLGAMPAAAAPTLQLLTQSDQEPTTSHPSRPRAALAPDAMGLIAWTGRPTALRLEGPFTAVVLLAA